MQKNKVLLLILLGLGISLELVLGLYLLNRSTARKTGVSSLSTRATLVSTLAVQFPQANAGPNDNNPNNLYPVPASGDPREAGMTALPASLTATPAATGAAAAAFTGAQYPAAGQAAAGYPAPLQNNNAGAVPSGASSDPGGVNYDHTLPNLNAPWMGDMTGATAQASATAAQSAQVTSTVQAAATNTPAPTAVSNSGGAGTATATPALSRINRPTATALPAQPTSTARPASPTATTASTNATAEPALLSVPVSSPPDLAALSSDPAWSTAPALTVTTAGGANRSATQVTLRSVYAQGRVYFLLTWADATQSVLLSPWEKQASGAWAQLSDPNRYAMDQIALAWASGSNLADFTARGCDGLCAAGTTAMAANGAVDDLWQWSPVTDVGQVDDGYLDGSGAHPDPASSGGDYANITRNGKGPQYMPPGGGDKTGAPGFILDAQKTPLDDSLFQPGDRLPSLIVAPYSGDRGDISAAWGYADGHWTLAFSRALVTGSTDDVQFSDLARSYPFGLATFDNSLEQFAAQTGGARLLRFQK